jgi:hypothetical protein
MTYSVIVIGDWWRFFSCWISSRQSTMFGTLCCWKNFHCTLSSGVLWWLWLVLIFQIDISVCLWVGILSELIAVTRSVGRVLCWDLYTSRYLSTILLPRSTSVWLYIWAAENGLCLNSEKSQAIVISFPGISCGGCSAGFNGECTDTFLYESKELGTDH